MKRLLAVVLAFAVSASACTDSTGPGDSLAGTYTLRSVNSSNGLPAPLFYNNANDHVEIVSGSLTLTANGDYEEDITADDTNYGPTTRTLQQSFGRWAVSGNEITLTDNLYGSTISYGTVVGSQITLSDIGGASATAVFTK
jgi:hypothetical protein